jgi:hypothetical protein
MGATPPCLLRRQGILSPSRGYPIPAPLGSDSLSVGKPIDPPKFRQIAIILTSIINKGYLLG